MASHAYDVAERFWRVEANGLKCDIGEIENLRGICRGEGAMKQESEFTGFRILPGWGQGPVAEFDRRDPVYDLREGYPNLAHVVRFNRSSLETRIRNLAEAGFPTAMEERALSELGNA